MKRQHQADFVFVEMPPQISPPGSANYMLVLFVFIGIAGRLRWAYGRVFFFLFVLIGITGRCGHPFYTCQVAARELEGCMQ